VAKLSRLRQRQYRPLPPSSLALRTCPLHTTRFAGRRPHLPGVPASLPIVVWRMLFPMPAMPWVGIRLVECESGARCYARRGDREAAPRHVGEHHQGQLGVSAEAIPDALENPMAPKRAVRQSAAVGGGSVGALAEALPRSRAVRSKQGATMAHTSDTRNWRRRGSGRPSVGLEKM
jgi:hypothetical protein